MTKAELIKELEGIPDNTIIQVWTQWDHNVWEDLGVDIITDGPDDEIIQAVHITAHLKSARHRPRRKTPPKTNEN